MAQYLVGPRAWVTMATPWDREKLARFCEVGFYHFKRQLEARLSTYSFDDKYGRKHPDTMRKEIKEAILEEMFVLQEVLIRLALEEKILKRGDLEKKPARKRSMFITAEEEE